MEYHKCYRCICSVCQDNNSCSYHRCDECDPEEEHEWVFCCGDVKRKEEDE